MIIRQSLVQLIIGRWREFQREPSALFFVILTPILAMILLGLAFEPKVKKKEDVILGIIEDHNTHNLLTTALQEVTEKNSPFNVEKNSKDKMFASYKSGKVSLIVEQDSDKLLYHFDPQDLEARKAQIILNDLLQRRLGRKDIFQTKYLGIKKPERTYISFLVPGLLALSILTSSLFGTGMVIVVNRRENILKRYLVTPMNTYEYFLSHIIGRYIIFFVEFLAIMLCGYFCFNFTVKGRLLDYLALALLGTATFTSIAILCGSRLKNTGTYNGITNLILIPSMLLSGVYFSQENFPSWLLKVCEFFPLTPLVNGLRKIALDGTSFTLLQNEILVLFIYFIVASVGAKKIFKWY